MSTMHDQIKGGINVEEDIIGFLANEIVKTEGFTGLSEDAKQEIITRLRILVHDSERHRKELEALSIKY